MQAQYCLFRIRKSDRETLERLIFQRYPGEGMGHQWGTFFRFGFRRTTWGLAASFVAMERPNPGDLDRFSSVTVFRSRGVVHSHPQGYATFPSPSDHDMDDYYAEEFCRYGKGKPYASIIFVRDRDGAFRFTGRVFDRGEWYPVTEFLTVGDDLQRDEAQVFPDEESEAESAERTVLPAESTTARHFAPSNLERMHGSRFADAQERPPLTKVEIIARHIAAMVDAVSPQPGMTICDPACSTGGFLLAAHDYIAKHHSLDREQKKRLKSGTLFGIELVDSVARLCCMNLLLHGIGGNGTDVVPVTVKDALAGKQGEYDMVLANPPFGKKSSVTIVNEAGEQEKESLVINRDDFWASTSNKQLNFLQHIFTILKQHGRAAVVLPDNVLFEGGAGETIRRELLKQADVHTLLRLRTGIFYAQGVKANVLFFDRKPAQEKPWTQKLWIYDLRTNLHFTLKENTLKRTDLDDFVSCYNPKNRHQRKESERFKSFAYEELTMRDKANLDIFWLKDDALEESANLPAPEIIAQGITDDLEAALEQFATIAEDLKK